MDHELIYTSCARYGMDDAGLIELLTQSREKNARLNITGLLVYNNREFMQLLEGKKNDIFTLYDTIVNDRRHQQVQLLWDGEIEGRSFLDWSMAFLNMANMAPEMLKSYSRFLQDGLSSLHLTGNKSVGKRLIINMRDDFLRS
ncbi:MAG: BLUF domain-containing protein [Pseudomonadota bacterium]